MVPQFLQIVQGHSAIRSGVLILPLLLTTTVFVAISGQIVGKTGEYLPCVVGGYMLWCVGIGLLSTLNETTSTARLVGYLILTGAGQGNTLQTSVPSRLLFAHRDLELTLPSLITQYHGSGAGFRGAVGDECGDFDSQLSALARRNRLVGLLGRHHESAELCRPNLPRIYVSAAALAPPPSTLTRSAVLSPSFSALTPIFPQQQHPQQEPDSPWLQLILCLLPHRRPHRHLAHHRRRKLSPPQPPRRPQGPHPLRLRQGVPHALPRLCRTDWYQCARGFVPHQAD